RWCWLCRCRGREHYSSMPVACIVSTRAKPTCGLSTLWIRVTQRCCGCGTNDSADIRQWDTGSQPKSCHLAGKGSASLHIPWTIRHDVGHNPCDPEGIPAPKPDPTASKTTLKKRRSV